MKPAPTVLYRQKAVGAPPATLVHVGERRIEDFSVTVTVYDDELLTTETYETVAEIPEFKEGQRVWIQLAGLHEAEQIGALCERFGIHLLIAEDILNTEGIPKIEEFTDHLFVSVKVPRIINEETEIHQMSVILTNNTVISFTETDDRFFAPIHKRLQIKKTRIRTRGSGYLTWAILDIISDTTLAVINRLEDSLERIEDQISEGGVLPDLAEVHGSRRKVAKLFRIARPFRDIAQHLRTTDFELINSQSTAYFNDLYDHSVQAVELTEFLRDHASSLRELYYTTTSHRMNEVMKTLAAISAIFLPLTFLAGMYGMNFKVMPELHWKWGYPVLLTIFLTVGLGLVRFFRRKGWL